MSLIGCSQAIFTQKQYFNKNRDFGIIVAYLKKKNIYGIAISHLIHIVFHLWDETSEHIKGILAKELKNLLKKDLQDQDFRLLCGLLRKGSCYYENIPISILKSICGEDEMTFIEIINKAVQKDNKSALLLVISLLSARVGVTTSEGQKEQKCEINWTVQILDNVNFENLFSAILKIQDCDLLQYMNGPLFNFLFNLIGKAKFLEPAFQEKVKKFVGQQCKDLLGYLKNQTKRKRYFSWKYNILNKAYKEAFLGEQLEPVDIS